MGKTHIQVTVRASLLIGAFLAAAYVTQQTLFLVRGSSMEPTIADRSIVVVVPTAVGAPRVGDVVLLRHAWPDTPLSIKRLVAGPGDCVPAPAPPAGVSTPGGGEGGTPVCDRVPEGKAFLVGDNEQSSADSLQRGQVWTSAIVGSVAFAADARRPWLWRRVERSIRVVSQSSRALR